MKEYKQDNLTIYNADCMEIMSRYEDNYFDLAVVDPPYGIGADKAQNKAGESREKAKGLSKSGRGWVKYKETSWDDYVPDENYFIELFRVSKTQIIWGGNYFENLWSKSNSFIVWDKKQREFSLADGELAWYSKSYKAMRTFDLSRAEALHNNNETGGRFHPTQKPVKLYNWIYKNYAKEGQKILDTHLGSGSNAISAHYAKMGEFVGCELDKDYYEASIKRIYNETRQLELF